MSQGQDCAYSNIILPAIKLTFSTEQNQLYVQNTELQGLKNVSRNNILSFFTIVKS